MSNFSPFLFPDVHCFVSNSVNVRNEIVSNYIPLSALNTYTIFQLSLVNFDLIVILAHLVYCFVYVHTTFDNNLKSFSLNARSFLSYWLVLLLASENTYDVINLALIIDFYAFWNHRINFVIPKNFCKSASFTISFISYFHMSIISVSPESHILCFFVTDNMCSMLSRNRPVWVPLLLILLSNDIEINPGDHYQNHFFNFMNWNLNSLAKNNFERVQLIEAHNSLFDYDIISVCETSLNSAMEIPDPLLNDYTFIPANHPNDVTHGGVGLFYKNSLPLKPRPDLAFDESIVVELKFGRKKIFFTLIYRSPSSHHSSPEFHDFMNNFENLYSNIKNENPFATFFTGDFNGHSQLWWADGDTTPEGKRIEEMISNRNLFQVISEPTNFTPNKNPSCIDLLITDQPNLILDSGTRPSLDPKCHHQIIYGKINFKIPPPPPSERKIWHYNQANTSAIKRSMSSYPWAQQLNLNTDPNWQVKTFHEIFLYHV